MRRLFRSEDWLDPGEAVAAQALIEAATGRRLLDIGVGAGRTTGLLVPHVVRYVGIDSSPGMLELARRRHPDADLRLADARDLSTLGTRFDAVLFSFNGIDAMDHDDRARVLDECFRVLEPGGTLVLSMLNLDGAAYGERPLTARPTRGSRRTPSGMAHWLLGVPRGLVNFRRTHRAAELHGDWARWPLAAHEFRFLAHFTTLGGARRSLEQAGFVVEQAWASQDGRPLDLAAEHCAADSMQLLASRPRRAA